jgi:methionyl-tRNA formyltransferase
MSISSRATMADASPATVTFFSKSSERASLTHDMRIAFCGSDFFADCAEACLRKGHTLIAAFSYAGYNSNQRIKEICGRVGIELKNKPIAEDDLTLIGQQHCDLLLVAGYPFRVPAQKLASLGIKGVNIHPTMLPEGRGPWPLPHTILKRMTRSGVTIHKLRDTFDTGDILLQEGFEVLPLENLESLSCKIQMLAPSLLQNILEHLDHFWTNAQPQREGSYWGMPTESERILDWNQSVIQIDKVARAFGKDYSYAKFDGTAWLVQEVTVWPACHHFASGSVCHRTTHEVVVAASDGFVCLRHFKSEPKPHK